MKSTSMLRTFCVGAVVLALTGCSSLNPFAASPLKPAELKSFKPDLTVKTRWSVKVGDSETGVFSPAVYDDMVYVASAKGRLMAISKSTGQVKWTVEIKEGLKAGVAATVDTIAVIDTNNQLIGFDVDGRQKWKSKLTDDTTSVPVGAADAILVRPIDYSVASYSTETGGLRWRFQRQLPALTLRENAPVDVQNGRVYAGFPGGRLVGIDLAKGTAVWEGLLALPSGTTEIERISDVTGSPVYNFREVCAASFQGKVGCLDAVSGRPVWTKPFSSPSGASVDDRYLIAANESGELFAFSRNGGDEVWRVKTLLRRKPTVGLTIGRAVAVGDFDGYLHFISRDTGDTIARMRVGSEAFTVGPVSAGENSLVVQSKGGEVALLSVN